VTIPKADLTATGDKTYTTTGAYHTHKITLTQAQRLMVAAGKSVTVTSTKDMGIDLHDHDITVACA
jgi:hypothetical protein